MRNVTGDPWAGVCEGELFDPTPYVGAYVRYFVRHPTTQLMPRKVKTAFTARRRGPRDHRHPRHRLHRRAMRDGVRGFEMRVGGGTSIMPRVAPTLVRVRRGRRRRVPEGRRGRASASSTARTGCASTAPAPASRCSSTSSASTSCAAQVEEELEGDWVAERDFTAPAPVRARRGGRTRPAVPAAYASPNGDRSEFERFREANVVPQRQAGLLRRRRSRSTAAT